MTDPTPAAPAGGEWPTNKRINEAIAPAAKLFSQPEYTEFMAVLRLMSESHNALTADLAAARAKLTAEREAHEEAERVLYKRVQDARAEAERLRAKAELADEEARRRRSKCGGCKMGLERFPHRDTYIHFPSQVQYRELGFTFEYKEGVTATECEADKTPWLYRYDALQPTHEQAPDDSVAEDDREA